MDRWRRVVYPTKPGPSPLLGGLFLAGLIRPEDRVLDVGCGTGTDALGVAAWGVRRVTGVDVSARAIGIARRRAARRGLRVRFEVLDALEMPQRFTRGSFDVVVDTMLCNNLAVGEEQRYADAMEWALARGGRLVVQGRLTQKAFEAGEDLWIAALLDERFEVAGPVHVPLPESAPHPARVAAYVCWR